MRVFTVGHSNGAPERLLDLLTRHGVQTLVDVRTIPRSRAVPWASIDELPKLLGARGLAYEHRRELGGLRKPAPDSGNGAWENAGFRGYADYMQTDEFARAADRLAADARERVVCVMCAEAVPWRCHRSLLADALLVRGVEAVHLMHAGEPRAHALTRFARVDGTRITYPATTRQTRL